MLTVVKNYFRQGFKNVPRGERVWARYVCLEEDNNGEPLDGCGLELYHPLIVATEFIEAHQKGMVKPIACPNCKHSASFVSLVTMQDGVDEEVLTLGEKAIRQREEEEEAEAAS